MANAQRGEVSFQALGREWKVKLGTNALCEIEAELGKGINEVGRLLSDPEKLTMSLTRTVFRAGLAQFHEDVTPAIVGDIIDEIGFEEAGGIIARASLFAAPEAKGGKNPRKATAASTGRR